MISMLEVIFSILFTLLALSALYQLATSFQIKDDGCEARVFKKLDIVGLPTGLFPWARAWVQSLTAMQDNVHQGYRSISLLEGRPFELPTMIKQGAVLVMPPSMLSILTRPESDIKAFHCQLDSLQLPYMISDRDIYMNPIHFDVVRKHMVSSKDIGALAPITADEILASFREIWGTSHQWTTVNGWDFCGRIIARAATRVLVGLPACRDDDLAESSRLFSDSVMLSTAILNCLPPMVRRLIGPVVALRAKHYRGRCLKVLLPYVETRMQMWKNVDTKDKSAPNDFLQWMISKCAKSGPEQLTPVKLATRLMTMNVMFVVAMAYVFSHAVVDIYSNSCKDHIVNMLVDECTRVSSEYGGLESKEAVDHLYRIDSAIRESMRLSDVAVTALARDVISKSLELDDGTSIPQGRRIVFPTQSIHQDPGHYADPLSYDPFRFSSPFENGLDDSGPEAPNRQNITTVTESFLPFGYGRHVCPGRYWVAQTMKQALASLVMDYDVEVVNKPGKRQVLANMMVPPVDVKFRIRRKH